MAVILAAAGEPPPVAALEAAALALARAQVVGLPTDTVYGLAADPSRAGATDRLFAIKGRPRTVEIPVLVADVSQALSLVTGVTGQARALMEQWWPGALTLVVPRRPDLLVDLGHDQATVGLRCPDHPVPRALAARVGPLATTSANRHGRPPLTTAAAVEEGMGSEVALVLDAGPCTGTPSTVVDCTGDQPRCLRQGRIPWAEICATLTDGGHQDR